MRVLHILNELNPSGAETMLRTAAPYWHEQQIHCDILSTGENLGTYASLLKDAGYRIHHIPFSRSYRFLRAVYNVFKSFRYDAIHIHCERANFWYAFLAYFSHPKTIVRTTHNVFQFKGSLRLKRLIQRWVIRNVFGVHTVSISSSVVTNEWRAFRNPSSYIPNWFDSSKFLPASIRERAAARRTLKISENTIVVTSVSACWPFKNHPAIIEALRGLPDNSSILYYHVGQETSGYPERKMAALLKVSHRIRFAGVILDILPILYASDVFLMPSVYEGFGVAAVEAMGAGVPVILSKVPGLRDFEDCKDIFWVEPNVASIHKCIQQFLDTTAADRNEIGLRLSQYAHARFAVDKGATAYDALYHGGVSQA